MGYDAQRVCRVYALFWPNRGSEGGRAARQRQGECDVGRHIAGDTPLPTARITLVATSRAWATPSSAPHRVQPSVLYFHLHAQVDRGQILPTETSAVVAGRVFLFQTDVSACNYW